MGKEIFNGKIRKVTEKDRKILPTYSYSRLEVFKNCPMRYFKENIDGKKVIEDSLPLELGSICHKVLEEKGKILKNNNVIIEDDYVYLNNILMNGADEKDKEYKQHLPGVKEIKKKYFEEWYQSDNASGTTYEDKLKVFDKVLHKSMEDTDQMDYGMWYPLEFEKYFEFVWKDRAILHGYIDRIDEHRDESIRTIDYKTSKKIYSRDKTATSLQFGIYALSILLDYGELPVESIYDFVLLDEQQRALSFGWEKRLEKALDKLLDQIDEMRISKIWPPKPSPLCAWCSFSETNPNAKKYKYDCEYHSNWTETDRKNFSVNRVWNSEDANKPIQKRKLVF